MNKINLNPKLYKVGKIVMKCGFYYTDLITDIMLMFKIF